MGMKGFGLQSSDCDSAGKVGRRVFKLLRGAHGFWRIRLTWIVDRDCHFGLINVRVDLL
jgi:hypothetical protein